jgi:PAS domain S-box-containing protein
MTQKIVPVSPFTPQSPDPAFGVSDILNSLPVGVIVVDEGGVVTHCNQESATLLSVPAHKLIGFELVEILPKSGVDILDAMSGGRQDIGLAPPELDNCYLQIKPLPGPSKGATITLFDQRFWQPYLQSNLSPDPLTPYYKQIFERSEDGISIVDSEERIILINDASANQLGLSREEVQGKTISFLVENKLTSDTISRDVFETGRPITRLIQHYKTGKHILLTGNPIFSRDGEVRLVLVNERDLTELLKLQTSLRQHKFIINQYKDELTDMQQPDTAAREIVSQSPVMVRTLESAAKLARHKAPQILLTGESGVGKGLVAKFIHSKSPRSSEPLIHINCAALPEQLLEGELFGYERGAFTGAATEGRAGLFEVAGKGTVFLDEIGEMPIALQSKLLTFLDTRSFRRIRGHRVIKSEATIIAATNQNLRELIDKKLFRSDLYYRLSLFRLNIPPLRFRREDVLEIARREIDKLNERYELKRELDQKDFDILLSHSYPGNVRELINCLHQAYILSEDDTLCDLLDELFKAGGGLAEPKKDAVSDEERLSKTIADAEKQSLIKALAVSRNTREMAEVLGISQAGVSRKLKKYGLSLPKFHRFNSVPAPLIQELEDED